MYFHKITIIKMNKIICQYKKIKPGNRGQTIRTILQHNSSSSAVGVLTPSTAVLAASQWNPIKSFSIGRRSLHPQNELISNLILKGDALEPNKIARTVPFGSNRSLSRKKAIMIQLRPADTAHFRTGSPFDKQRLFIQIKCKANTPWKGLSLRGTYPRERSPKYTNWALEKICNIRSLSHASTCWSKLGRKLWNRMRGVLL